MKRISSLFLAFALILGLCACAKADPWQEQYDLGVRYLSEGNYEEAIIAFTAAIEIDPKRPEAYLDMAYAYIGQNDFDAAREILARGYELTQDDALKAKLDELDSGNITDYAGNIRKISFYDGSGALAGYQTFTYDSQNREASATSFDAAGNQTGHVDLAYDAAGKQLVSYSRHAYTGEIISRLEYEYDSNGKVVKESSYDLTTGELEDYELYQYDEQGRHVRRDSYSGEGELELYFLRTYGENSNREDMYGADGTLWSYHIWNYREDGQIADFCGYNADGALERREVYRYDDDGNCIGSDTYDGEGSLTGSEVYG